jgi:hypothetical protein
MLASRIAIRPSLAKVENYIHVTGALRTFEGSVLAIVVAALNSIGFRDAPFGPANSQLSD